jgi:hypothetical protein
MQEKKQFLVDYILARWPVKPTRGQVKVEAWDDIQAMKLAKQQLYGQVGRKNALVTVTGVVAWPE